MGEKAALPIKVPVGLVFKFKSPTTAKEPDNVILYALVPVDVDV